MTKGSEEGRERLARLRLGGAIPRHVAVIMDGNGRWARDRGLPRWEGHRAGMAAVREVVEGALEAGLAHLTLYAFSTENWERPKREISALMSLLRQYVEREKQELARQGVRVRVFGELDRLSDPARQAVEDLERTTRAGSRMCLNLAISYSSRTEIVHAARQLAELVRSGSLRPGEIDEERFALQLYTCGMPDPDLLIRTSGENRISNFLLWQVAYAELYVTTILWPDFQRADLFEALLDYQRRDRRFGKVTA